MQASEKRKFTPTGRPEGGEALARWHAVWVHSHCERLVRDQLSAKGFDVFLPEVSIWTLRADERQVRTLPLFPGYLFVHHAMDKESHVRLLDTRGLVRILGERWDRLAVVPDVEVEAVRRLVESRVAPAPHPYLREGRRVRIGRGPLAGVEGILVEIKPDKCLLVISIELFQRSVAVEVDCAHAVAA
jgi:transcriptional antiterminator NusG